VTGSAASLSALVGEYDARWSALDFAGVADLWEDNVPQPVYIGDEYAMPLIGTDELERHWARIAGRLKHASVSSQLRSADLFADGFARCVVLSRWSFTGRESDVEHSGSSWITWMLVARGEQFRIFHHMESQVYLDDGLADDRSRRRKDETA
jgi:ketosteroid isomerase-like protein